MTRNSFTVRLQMAGKANPRPEQSWAVGARDDGDSRWCGGAFPDLSALLSCCSPVRFAGFGATLDGCIPLVSVLSHLLPVNVRDPKGLEGDLQGVFEVLLLSSLGAFAFLKFPEQHFLWKSVVCHASHVPSPAELGLHQNGVDAGEVCMGEDLGFRNLFLPLDAENFPKAGGVEVPLVCCW